jgi:hypothetical protein
MTFLDIRLSSTPFLNKQMNKLGKSREAQLDDELKEKQSRTKHCPPSEAGGQGE